MTIHALVLTMKAELIAVDGQPVPAAPEQEIDSKALAGVFGGDVHLAGGVGLLRAHELGLGPADQFTVTLDAPDEIQVHNGAEILAAVRDACERADHETLRRLIAWFSLLALRVREVHRLLDRMPCLRDARAIAGLSAKRGRPMEHARTLAIVHTLDRLSEAHGVSIAEAARLLAKAGVNAGVETLRNIHARHAKHARMRARGIYVPASHLEPRPWGQTPTTTVHAYSLPMRASPGHQSTRNDMPKKSPSPNDQRSNVKNPNNPAYHQDRSNRGTQLNPKHPNYGGGESERAPKPKPAPKT